jgi:hypothetical protein
MDKINKISVDSIEYQIQDTELTGVVDQLKYSKQDVLTSGLNIKTINGESVLGEGDINTNADNIQYLTSDPNLDFDATGNNVDCFGFVGNLKNQNVYGDSVIIDSISVYVREGNASPNLTTQVWCRLLRFVNDSWEIVYQSETSQSIENIQPETLFTFKVFPVVDNYFIKTSDRIAIVYVDNKDADVLAGNTKLGFKSISIGGGLQNALTNASSGNSSWAPAFVFKYFPISLAASVDLNSEQIITARKQFNSGLNISDKTIIDSNIDSGELKVFPKDSNKGFIIRSANRNDNIPNVEILGTNTSASFNYSFPKKSGTVALIDDVQRGQNYIEVTYSELKSLRNNSQLVPGASYRIIDYTTEITSFTHTVAGHDFDIIVKANDVNILDHDANVIETKRQSDSSQYFSNNKLQAWTIKYDIDNDNSKYGWANASGKGVIYYMKDEYDNECPYDFKNILFNGTHYTFSYEENGQIYDSSLKSSRCFGNIIYAAHTSDGVRKLNGNVFKNSSVNSFCNSNTFEYDCENNVFGDSCVSNAFGNYCSNNVFGNNCQYNTFDDYCQSNTFGLYCQSNTFGVYCQSNTFGSYVIRISFGKQCLNNKFSNSSSGDNLSEAYRMIKFGDQCNGVNLYNTSGTSYSGGKWLQNVTVSNGMSGNIKIDDLNEARTKYVTKNSSGGVLQYFESDLMNGGAQLSGGESLIKVTYSELKTLRDNSQLVPGTQYRITDYEFTTIQEKTKSAGHIFDIIVLATAENQLSELARAIQHEGDTYFDGNDLGAWELWYDLDNDTNKYGWADSTNGKGVIYRMIDDKRNDCPYDFKNTLFYNTKLISSTTTDKYYYTFSYVVSKKLYDGTVETQVMSCHDNSMGAYIKSNNKKFLNLNVFRNTAFGSDCQNNTFGSDCYSNTFGNSCYSNTFGNSCYSNTFGDTCQNNTFGIFCQNNTFGIFCQNNTFGSSCQNNTFGSSCYSNTFGDTCQNNTFGDTCYYNTFENYCYSNTFENYCYSNTFGGYVCNRELNKDKTSITLNDEYFDDGSGQLVPIKHPDLSTQPSILPYKFMGQYVYEQLIPKSALAQDLAADFFEVKHDKILFLEVVPITSSTENSKVYGFNIAPDGLYLLTANGVPSSGFSFPYLRVVYTSMPEENGGNYGYNNY